MKRIVCIGLLFAALGLIVCAPAQASGGFRVQTFINPDGSGEMYASGNAPFIWDVCSPDVAHCVRFAKGQEVSTSGASAGAVFRLRDGGGESFLSPEWRGPVKELGPPRIAGIIAANEFVSPVPGLWSGGWKGEDAEMQIAACVTEAGQECVSLTDPRYFRVGCSWSDSFALEPRFVGWYLRVADRQSGGPHAETAVGAISPFGAEILRRSRNTSVSILGQIAAAVIPPAGECGAPPSPIATISPEGTARVECGGGCSVTLIGTRNGRKQAVTRYIREGSLLRPEAALEMSLSHPAMARLGAGKIQLTVEADGKRLARRTIRTSDS